MSIEAIGAMAILPAPPLATTPPPAQAAGGFGNWFANELGSVNSSLVKADQEVSQVALGETQSLHEVMIHLEEAKLSFQLLAQVRNRLLSAYQEVMRTQV